MATSGSYTTPNGYTDEYGTRKLIFTWQRTSRDIANNTSTISWTLSTDGGFPYWINYRKTRVVIDGVQKYYVEGAQAFPPSSPSGLRVPWTITSGTVTLTHNSVGERSFSVSISAGIYTSAVNASGTATFTLDTIPRASTVTGTGLVFGQEGTLNISRASSSFTDTITYSLGGYSGTIATKTSAASVAWTPDVNMMNAVPSATSAAVSVTCKTYSGDTLIATKTTTVTVSVPASVVPTASVQLTNTDTTFGGYTQGVSKVRVRTTASGQYGANITGITVTFEGTNYSGSDITTNTINGSGSLTVKTKVTDSRGRSTTLTNRITVQAYSTPTMEYSAHRCAQDGTADDMGAYVNVWIHGTATAVGNNAASVAVRMRQAGTSAWTTVDVSGDTTYTSLTDFTTDAVIPAADTSSWEIQAVVSDLVNSVTQTIAISVGYSTIDFLKGGRGIAFGTTAADPGFDCAMDAVFDGTLAHSNGTGTMDVASLLSQLWGAYAPVIRHGTKAAQTVTVDLSDFVSTSSGTLWACLVVTVNWVSPLNSVGVWVVHGVADSAAGNDGVSQVFHETYGGSVSFSGNTLTISFYDTNGGGYAVIPLFGKNDIALAGGNAYT